MHSKILFITTTNLSTNPRLLKEIKLATAIGYRVRLIAFKLGNWSDKTDNQLSIDKDKMDIIYLSAIKKPFFNWLISTLIWKLCSLFSNWFNKNLKLNAYSHNKRTWQINRHLKSDTTKYDLIIAHNLGALYPAYQFSKKNNAPFAFDIEDYHPGENCSIAEKNRREFLMKKMLPQATYITYASPLIGEYTLRLLVKNDKQSSAAALSPHGRGQGVREISANKISKPSIKKPKIISTLPSGFPPNRKLIEDRSFLIYNSFPQSEFQFNETQGDKLKLVWFSQNINAGRGLEIVVPTLATFKNKIELTLIGNLIPNFYNNFLSAYASFIKIEKPLIQRDLNLKLSEFDIGLAIEVSTVDLNKDIALSNKIFAYAQSGLYILATNTTAQEQFIEEHPQLGKLMGQTTQEIEDEITFLIQNIDIIRAQKKNRFEYAKKLAWEIENQKLIQIWNKALNQS